MFHKAKRFNHQLVQLKIKLYFYFKIDYILYMTIYCSDER